MLTSTCIQSKDRKLDFLPHDIYEGKETMKRELLHRINFMSYVGTLFLQEANQPQHRF